MSAMKYKSDFCKANQCTPQKFERAYVKFMEKYNHKPKELAYRRFAKRWKITIHTGLGDPKADAALSVSIAVIKVMASSEQEAKHEIQRLVADSA